MNWEVPAATETTHPRFQFDKGSNVAMTDDQILLRRDSDDLNTVAEDLS